MTPALIAPQRALPKCPVCGKIAYSAGGIHPQCAANREGRLLRAQQPAKNSSAPINPADNPQSLPLSGVS